MSTTDPRNEAGMVLVGKGEGSFNTSSSSGPIVTDL